MRREEEAGITWQNSGEKSRSFLGPNSASPLPTYVTLSQLFNLPKPQSTNIQNGDNNGTYCTEVVVRIRWNNTCKCLTRPGTGQVLPTQR